MLLDLVAKGFITEAATKLLNGSFDEVHLITYLLFSK